MNTSASSAVANSAQILTLIQSDLSYAEALAALLQREQEALASRQRQVMSELLDEKVALLNNIDRNAGERYQLLQALGCETNELAWQTLIESQNDEKINQTWRQLQDVLAECKKYNAINGKVIARSRQSLNKLIHILRGQIHATETYNQKGSTEGAYHSSTVVKA